MLPSWADDRVNVIEPTWVDERGKQVAVYPDVPGTPVDGCSVQSGAATTQLQMRDNVAIEWTAFVPPEATITRHAQIKWQGEKYKIDGIPLPVRSPLGTLDHTVLPLIRWEG